MKYILYYILVTNSAHIEMYSKFNNETECKAFSKSAYKLVAEIRHNNELKEFSMVLDCKGRDKNV